MGIRNFSSLTKLFVGEMWGHIVTVKKSYKSVHYIQARKLSLGKAAQYWIMSYLVKLSLIVGASGCSLSLGRGVGLKVPAPSRSII